jgi:hypothetical protein
VIDHIHSWEDDGGAIAPDYESLYIRDRANSQSVGLTPNQPIDPNKVGVINVADVGYQVSCTGFMGNESLTMFHFVDTVAEGITWLQSHGCGKIVNITADKIL